jgi:hypothetical protein
VSHAHLEAFRVYKLEPATTSDYAVPDNDAFLAAVDVILPRPGSVVGIEVAVKGSPDDPLSKAANTLQGAGSVVVAAIGNHGRRSDTNVGWDKAQGPRSPGVARGVLGIGARPLGAITVLADPMQSHGIVQHRFKPDIQLPTGTISAASGSGSNTRELPATSGATPYAVAVASAMRSWLSPPGDRADPGQVYACLVACGEMARVDSFPVIRGAGLVRLPVGGQGWWGDVDLGTDGHSDIPIMVNDPTVRRVSVGLWWLDGGPLELPLGFAVDRHRDFDLEVEGPLAGQRKKSAGVDGVFERVDFTSTTSMTGRWIVHIKGGLVGLGQHTVYWAAFATP